MSFCLCCCATVYLNDTGTSTNLVSRCVFLQTIPDTGDHCPGVATHSDHYYCMFGPETGPEWFCTCIEMEGDYIFHCNDHRAKSPTELLKYELASAASAAALAPEPTPATLKPVETTPHPTVIITAPPQSTVQEVQQANSEVLVHAGDVIDLSNGEPQWWHNMHDKYGHTMRKCVFEQKIPNTGDSCPGVATHNDHYFCVWGTMEAPSWFCTCREVVGDYAFHCNYEQLRTPEEIQSVVDEAEQVVKEEEEALAEGLPIPPDNTSSSTPPPPPPPPASTPAPVPVTAPTPAPVRAAPTGPVKPGDVIDWSKEEPDWWNGQKDMLVEQLRK